MSKELKMNREYLIEENPPFPRNMLMELTNICNHNCVFCHYKNMTRKKRKCNKEFSFYIMQQAYDNGTREIGFYMIGEPLLNPDIEKYIKKAKEIGFEYVYLTSNGALADLEKMKKLINAGLDSIKFSINAGTSEHYKFIHGKDDYIMVKENVRALGRYIRNENIDLNVFISFVKTKITDSDSRFLHRDFADYVDKIYEFDCGTQGTPMKELIEKNIVDKIKSGSMPCEMVFNRLHVTCEGYLDACCVDADGMLTVADLHSVSLKDAWNSEIMRDLRKQFIDGKLKKNVCYNCVHNTNDMVYPLNDMLYKSLQKTSDTYDKRINK